VRGDDQARVLAAGDRNGHRRWETAGRPESVDDLPNGAEVNGVVFERLDESLLEIGGTGSVEDLEKAAGGASDIASALGDGLEKRLAVAGGLTETVEPAVLVGAPLRFTRRSTCAASSICCPRSHEPTWEATSTPASVIFTVSWSAKATSVRWVRSCGTE